MLNLVFPSCYSYIKRKVSINLHGKIKFKVFTDFDKFAAINFQTFEKDDYLPLKLSPEGVGLPVPETRFM